MMQPRDGGRELRTSSTISVLFVLLFGYVSEAQACTEGQQRRCDPGDGCVGQQECTPRGTWDACVAVCCPGLACDPPGGQPGTGITQCQGLSEVCVCPVGQERVCFPEVQPVTFSSSGLGSRDFVATGASAPDTIGFAIPSTFSLSVRAAPGSGATQVAIVGTALAFCSRPGWIVPWELISAPTLPINISSSGDFLTSPFDATQWNNCAAGDLDSVEFYLHGEATNPSGRVGQTRVVRLRYLATIRVMTFNLDWGDCGPRCDPQPLRAGFIRNVIATYADIAGLQEASQPNQIIPPHYYDYRTTSNSGNVILSRFPIVSQHRLPLRDRDHRADLLDVVVDVGGIPVRILDTHGSVIDDVVHQQAQQVRDYLDHNNGRMALTADWNLGPPDIHQISDRFQDTYAIRAFGYSSDCPIIENRIDYVFNDALASQPLVALDSVALCTRPISGHRPIVTRFRLLPPPAPAVAQVTPSRGPIQGGTPVTIRGANFAPGATVTFGGIPATNITFVDAMTITAITPAHPFGPVDVSVTVNGQTSSRSDAFYFVLHPAQIMGMINGILD